MLKGHYRRRTSGLALLVLTILVLSMGMVSTAGADVTPYQETPGYPKYGCYDIATAGIGMWSGQTPYQQTVNVPGPVVDAYLYWIGTEDAGAPNAPDQSDLIFNGTTVVGDKVDREVYGTNNPDWFMWRANIGPSGYNLIGQGLNKFTVSGWEPIVPTSQNGLSVVVVYDTGACDRPNQIDLVDSTDYYWENLPGQETTDPMIFTFPPAPVKQDITIWLHHAGTDHRNPCRPENIWEASGTGTPPDNIIQYGNPSTGLHGSRQVVTNGFTSSTCGATSTAWPVTGLVGWVDGFGPTPGVGGYVSPEWSVIQIKVEVPAGNTWVALQAESAYTGSSDPEKTGESGAWFAQAAIPLYEPELRITKTDGVDLADPGDTLTYTLDYENYGYGPAENTTIVDTLPDHATFISASNGGVYDNVAGTVTWNLGTLDRGVSGQVTVTVQLDPVFQAGTTTLTNRADISTTTQGEQDTSDNSATDTTDVFAAVELNIAKSAAPEPVDAGTNLTYTIDWTVGGNAYAPGVTLVDTLPNLVSFVSASNGGVYDAGTNTVTWNLGDVTPVITGTYTVEVAVDTPLYNGTMLDNTVVIADTIGDSATAAAASTVRSDHVLDITKTAAPEPVEAGDNLTYTIDWAVTGNEPSPDATIVDTLPDNVAFVSATGGGVYDDATRTVTWNLGELMTPQSDSFEVVVAVDTPLYNGTQLTNQVVFSDSDPGTDAVDDAVVSTVHSDHVLHISKDDTPDPVEKGAELTYTIDWSVTGNEPADNVVISDPLPFGTQFVSATGGGVYDPSTGTVTWNLGTQMTPQSGTVTLVVKVNKDFPNGLDINNRATINDDKSGKEKEADAVTKVVQTPEGSIGDTVWYDTDGDGIEEPGEPGIAGVGLILYDAGPDGGCGTADDVALGNAVTDSNGKYRFNEIAAGTYCVDVINSTLPAGLILTGGSDPYGPILLAEGEQYRDADFGYGPPAGTGTIGDRIWSDADGDGTQDTGEAGIGNVTLSLRDAGADGLCGTADDTEVATTTTAADGSYLFTGVVPGTYCVQVTDANGVLVGLTLTGGTNPQGPITVTTGNTYLDADFGYQGAAYTGQIGDTIFYDGNRSGVYEPGPVERGIADVTLSLVAPGSDGVFGTADDVTMATATTDANGHYLFNGLPDGDYQVIVTDLNGRLLGYTQTYGVPDTDNNGQVSPYAATITGGNAVLTADFGYADGHLLDVVKVDNVAAGQPVEAGADMIYTISYSASGREPAPNVTLRDILPTQVDFVSASDGGTYDAVTRLVTWNLGNLNPGDNGSVTLTVHVKKPLPNNSYIFNTVTIIDDARVTDESTDVVRVHAEPILSLTKANNPTGEVEPGDAINYTLCYANTGNGNATDVVLTDVIPVNTTYVAGSATGGATYSEATSTLTWNLGTVGPDASTCVTFDVTVNMTIAGLTGQATALSFAEWNSLSIDNTATLVSDQLPDLTAAVSNPLNATVDPAIYKSASQSVMHTGETLVFTVTVTNRGTANANDVIITDGIHPKLENVTLSSTKGTTSYDAATRMWTVNVGLLAPNETVTVVITGQSVRVPAQELPYQITDTATVDFREGAPRNSNEVVVDVVYFQPGEVPEASTWLLLGSGLAGLFGYVELRARTRRRKKHA